MRTKAAIYINNPHIDSYPNYAGIKHLGATVVPGSGPAFIRMGQALTETVDEYGRSYEFGDELLGVAGIFLF